MGFLNKLLQNLDATECLELEKRWNGCHTSERQALDACNEDAQREIMPHFEATLNGTLVHPTL